MLATNRFFILCISLTMAVYVAGCSSNRYNTQKGAAIGAAFGAGVGQVIGRDTESTLLGTALGGLIGAVVGNYEDQRFRYAQPYQNPINYTQPQTAYSYEYTNAYRHGGTWVTVPGQFVGSRYVPPHQAWVPPYGTTAVVVERP